ncbi:phage tail protein [Carnobacterium divergens]|uniref:Phage tail protein n=1 Tax=Carnobacterium divergens TaxID=2748 RepID=A0AAW8RC04_CARDV|nr:phage tail spike protein [Carnobacterium divergens]MDT1957570.1 phage tail protein [Carnobacterium divergens]MDT1973773.1 phage tail protein [Carnobacterium divergens]
MITLYKKDEKDFFNNGLGDISSSIQDAVISWTDNDQYMLTFKYSTISPLAAFIDGPMIIKAKTPSDGYQLFRINKIKKNMGLLEISAFHIFYDLIDNIIEDTFVQGQTGAGAIDQIGKKTQYAHPFNFYSDIDKVANSRIVRMNPVTALIDSGKDNSFISRWGGHLVRDNFKVSMLKKIGHDRGVTIQNKKNLLGYNADVDWMSPVTRIMPKGFDGLLLPEKYIDSPLINTDAYPHPKILEIEFPDIKAIKEGEYAQEGAVPLNEAYKLLREAAKKKYEIEKIDYPIVNYKVDFVELSKTEEYKDFEILETIDPGDTVTVIHDEDGINIKAEMIQYTYDPVREMYLSIELGNYKESFTDIKNQINNVINDMNNMEAGFLDTAKGVASTLIKNGFGGHVRVYPDRILIMDTPDEKTARRVWQWNINGFGYSRTGVNGEYGLAITMDGSIVADFINVGKLRAGMIQVGFNGINSFVSIDGAGFNVRDATGGLTQLNQTGINFYNRSGQLAGSVSRGQSSSDGDALGIVHDGSEGGNQFRGNLFQVLNAGNIFFTAPGDRVALYSINGDTVITNLNVTGKKNAVHPTRDGIRATPAYETAESYLGDIGESKTNENKEMKIFIETLFSDTVNTIEYSYQVFLQSYGEGHIWVSERNSDHFIVKSNIPSVPFAWEIKAKRRGYETDRLTLVDMTNEIIENVWREEVNKDDDL